MNRADFQKLAEMRLEDAKALLDQNRWAGAYYLAGYAVECGLKACIIARLRNSEDWLEKSFSQNCYQHDPEALLTLAGLMAALSDEAKADAKFKASWEFVKDWEEESRYEHDIDEQQAKTMYEAVAEPDHGVLQWLKKHW